MTNPERNAILAARSWFDAYTNRGSEAELLKRTEAHLHECVKLMLIDEVKSK